MPCPARCSRTSPTASWCGAMTRRSASSPTARSPASTGRATSWRSIGSGSGTWGRRARSCRRCTCSTAFPSSAPRRERGPRLRSIDIHAHVVPQSLWHAADAGKPWHGYRHEPGEGVGVVVGGGRRHGFVTPKVRFTPEQRIQDMDAQGVDVQVLSIHTPLFGYHLDGATGLALAREVNDEIPGMVRGSPRRFAGLATLPMQDVGAAIAELERAVTTLGLKGAELDTAVNGENWDAPKFLPFFKAAEAMGAVLFYHPQPFHN